MMTPSVHNTAAALYVRLSKEDKHGKQAGCDSIKVQSADGTDAIQNQGWAFDGDRHVFEDDDVSGTTLRRRGWDALIAAAKRREFSILVVRDLARLSRYEPARTMATLVELRDLGVRVWSYKKREFLPLDGLDAILTFVDAIGNQQYVESIRTNTRAALRKRAAEGRAVNRPTFGYRIEDHGPSGKRWVIDPEGAATCHRVASTLIGTGSFFGAARRLNDEGVRASKGRAWSGSTVRELVRRTIYRGVYEYGSRGEDAVVVDHPELRIWTPDEEAAIDSVLARPSKPWGAAAVRHMSTRVVRCGLCGGALISTSSKRSKGSSLRCAKRQVRGCPGIGYKREHMVDAAVCAAVAGLVTGEVWERCKATLRDALAAQVETDQRAAEVDRLRRDVAASARRVRNLTESVAEEDDATARGSLREALRAEGKRLDGLKGALARAEAAPAPESPAAVLEEAERAVDAFRAALSAGGAQAAEAIGAVLGEEKFTATREGERWVLTARANPGGMFGTSAGTRSGKPRKRSSTPGNPSRKRRSPSGTPGRPSRKHRSPSGRPGRPSRKHRSRSGKPRSPSQKRRSRSGTPCMRPGTPCMRSGTPCMRSRTSYIVE